MADLYLTLSKFPADAAERFAATLLRADATDLSLAFMGKDMTALECGMVRTAHAIIHGDTDAAEGWMDEYPALLERDRLTVRESALADMVDVIAETAFA